MSVNEWVGDWLPEKENGWIGQRTRKWEWVSEYVSYYVSK